MSGGTRASARSEEGGFASNVAEIESGGEIEVNNGIAVSERTDAGAACCVFESDKFHLPIRPGTN